MIKSLKSLTDLTRGVSPGAQAIINKMFDLNLAHKEQSYNVILKKKSGNRMMSSLYTREGRLLNDTRSMLEEAASYFRDSYTNDVDEENDLEFTATDMQNLVSPSNKLTDEDARGLDQDFTEDDFAAVVKRLSMKNTTPGLDDINYQFIHEHWEKIREVIIKISNCLKNVEGPTPTSLRIVLINLVEKNKNSKTKAMKDYRPILLGMSVAKLISSVFKERLDLVFKKIVPSWISAPTPTLIKDRKVIDRFVENIQTLEDGKVTETWGITIHFESAFETMSFEFLELMLELYNFNADSIRLIKALITDQIAIVRINNIEGDPVLKEKGLLFGNPLSLPLFLMAMKMLQTFSNNGLKDEAANRLPPPILFDQTFFIPMDEKLEDKILIERLAKFCVLSGMELNIRGNRPGIEILKSGTRTIYITHPEEESWYEKAYYFNGPVDLKLEE